MSNSELIYQGNVRIYLQGKGALQPFDQNYQIPYHYYIGSPVSEMVVKDFRKEPLDSARKVLSGLERNEFADVS